MNKLTWIQAVKLYSQQTGQKYKIPRKGTPQYDAVKRLMNQHNGMAVVKQMPKTTNTRIAPTQQKQIVNEVVQDILEEIDLSRASDMTKQILERHLSEAKREINDTFQGQGLDDLLNLVPESIVPKKDIQQVKKTAMDVSQGNISVNELKDSWKNIKKAVTKIDGLVKKGIQETQKGSGLTQIGSSIFDDIANFIKPLIPVLAPVANIPEIKNITPENVTRVWGQVKAAIKDVDGKVKKTFSGKGLKQLGKGHQNGGFLPFLIALIPTIVSALSTAASAAAVGAATYAGSKAAEAIGKAL